MVILGPRGEQYRKKSPPHAKNDFFSKILFFSIYYHPNEEIKLGANGF